MRGSLRLEDGAGAVHHQQVVRGEEDRPLRDLLHADPVLAGHAAAELDARFEDLPPGREHARDLAAVALVEEDDRMDVAVAGVKDVADQELVAGGGPAYT